MMSLEKYIHKQNKNKIKICIYFVFLTVALFYFIGFDFFTFFEGIPDMISLLKRILKPNISYSDIVWKAILDTIQMSLVGSFLGVICSIPWIFLTASNISFSKKIASILNRIFAILRTIPSLIWAAILVSVFSIGKFSGTVALIIIAFLISQKLLRERVEEIGENKLNSTLSIGASKIQLMKYSVMPEIKKHIISVFFIVLESNIRSATILGFVGAGGIGQIMWRDLNHLRFDNLATIILILFIVILSIDFLSLLIRSDKKIINYKIKTYGGFRIYKFLKKILIVCLILTIIVILKNYFNITVERFIKGLVQGKLILIRMCHLNIKYFPKIIKGIWDSFVIALFSTFFSGILGFILSFLTAYNSSPNKFISVIFKGLINIMRTIPPMIVAIIFFRGVGPGKVAGALALTVYTSGTLTKMYSEIIENVNKNIEDSIKSTGAKKIAVYISGLFRETYPSFIGVLLYRLESNIRNSTVLGIIGAGGIGTLLNMNIVWRNWENVGLIVLAIGIMIGSIDVLSRKIRMFIK
ncbi:MAG: phosphonate ABC transporter, permease protein PhnE [Fusobacterium sp. JB021]|nr:phosphonate ABC transporter, permease protein PhnE [Fusobacterium sp. JB021]MDP0507054.1 phosphonate ABC transporter, permease protein PhnE [Fusobacterium sp. JB019]